MTEEHATEPVDLELEPLGQPVEERDLLVRELLSRPVERVRRREALLAGRELAVGVAANPLHAVADVPAAARASRAGNGPMATSPPTRITASSGTSASTASSAGRLPWTS